MKKPMYKTMTGLPTLKMFLKSNKEYSANEVGMQLSIPYMLIKKGTTKKLELRKDEGEIPDDLKLQDYGISKINNRVARLHKRDKKQLKAFVEKYNKLTNK